MFEHSICAPRQSSSFPCCFFSPNHPCPSLHRVTLQAKHKDVNRRFKSKVAPSSSPVLASLAVRLHAWQRRLTTDPQLVREMLHWFAKTRHVRAIPDLLGFAHHPLVLELKKLKKTDMQTTDWIKVCTQILYSCDFESMAALDGEKGRTRHHELQQSKRRELAQLLATGSRKVSKAAELALVRAVEWHLRHIHEDGAYYSLPLAIGGLTGFVDYVSAVPGVRSTAVDLANLQGELHSDMEDVSGHRRQGSVVLRVVHLNVSRWHGMDSAFLPHFAGNSIVVAKHRVLSDSDGVLLINVRPEQLILLQCFTADNVGALRECFLLWRPAGRAKPFLQDGPLPIDADVVQEFLETQLGDGLNLTEDWEPYLEVLQAQRLVTEVDGGKWKLSDEGLSKVGYSMRLVLPTPVCACRAGLNDSLQEHTCLELFLVLEEQGWTLAELPKSKRERHAARYDIAQQRPKVMYERAAKLSAPYLRCLLSATQIMANNADITCIHHGETDRHYLALLAGHNPRAPLAKADVEEGGYVIEAPRRAKRARVAPAGPEVEAVEALQQGLSNS